MSSEEAPHRARAHDSDALQVHDPNHRATNKLELAPLYRTPERQRTQHVNGLHGHLDVGIDWRRSSSPGRLVVSPAMWNDRPRNQRTGPLFLPVDQLVGVSIVAVIASAGVLGLAIGFSAQSVVEDLLRGLFMLAEDQFGVGDRVDAVIIRVVCVEAGERRTFERELRRRLKADLDAAGIEMPNRQVDIWLRDQAQAA